MSGPENDRKTKEWRTVVVGLPIIRVLLAGGEISLDSLRISLIPDDVLWNARPEKTTAKNPPPTIDELEKILNSEDERPVTVMPDGSIRQVTRIP